MQIFAGLEQVLSESPQAVVACSISLFQSLNHGFDGSTTASISADQALALRLRRPIPDEGRLNSCSCRCRTIIR